MEHNRLRPSDPPLSEEITIIRFSRKFVMPSLTTARKLPTPFISASSKTKCRFTHTTTFSSDGRSLPTSRGVAYHWFYSLPKNSLRSFDDVTNAFYNQFAFQRVSKEHQSSPYDYDETRRESLKNYVNYFQS